MSERPGWEGRPVLAGAVRLVVALAPFLLSVLVILGVGGVWQRPEGLGPSILWWVALISIATLTMWVFDWWFRKLLPVAAMFRLSLVFPDKAPSRFKIALRSGTVRQLQRNVDANNLSSAAPQAAAEQLIELAAGLNAHDRLTRGHTERVRAYSVMIGEELGLPERDLELLNWSGLVHDIGKLTVPTEILNKPGKPSDAEWQILRDHPAEADRLIEPLRGWLGEWAESATQHHERFDGGGYPSGLAGNDISLAGRIVAVADAYDVMTSTRSYKKPMATEVARKELADNAGSQFDPVIVRAFLALSIGRLRLVMGPLSSLIQLPLGGASVGSVAVTAASAAATVVTAAALGVAAPQPVVDEAIVAEVTEAEAPALLAFADDWTVTTPEDVPIEISPASDLEGEAIWVSLTNFDPATGDATVEGESIRYTPTKDYNGRTDVTYRVCVDDRPCQEANLAIEVTPVNDPPVAADDTVTLDEDDVVTVDVVANDVDVDDASLTLLDASVVAMDDLVDGGAGADGDAGVVALPTPALAVVDGQLQVTPGRNDFGTAYIDYVVADALGEISVGRVVAEVKPVNDPPVTVKDAVTVIEGQRTEFDVLKNDYDVDGDRLVIASVGAVSAGSATTDGQTLVYDPEPGYTGSVTIEYVVSDNNGGRVATAIEPLVVAEASALDLRRDVVSTPEDVPISIAVLANDQSRFNLMSSTLRVVAGPSTGIAQVAGNELRYVPAADWSGTTTLSYRVCDDEGNCDQAEVSITVVPVNDAPVMDVGSDVAALEDAGATLVTGWVANSGPGANDERAQSVDFIVTVGDPSLFAVQPAVSSSGDLSFTPAANASGSTQLTVVAVDDGGERNGGQSQSSASLRLLDIQPVNDLPSFIAGADLTLDEDAGAVVRGGWGVAEAGAVNEQDQTVQMEVSVSNPSLFSEQPTVNADGDLSFALDSDAYGSATMTVTPRDDGGTLFGGNDTGTATTSTITVRSVNDAPTFSLPAETTVEEDAGQQAILNWILGATSGPSNEAAQQIAYTVTVADSTLFEVLPTVDQLGTLRFLAAPEASGSTTVTVTASDDGGIENGGTDQSQPQTSTLHISAINDAPIANPDQGVGFTTPEDVSFTTGDVTANDTDSDSQIDSASVQVVGAPVHGELTNNGDGTFDYTPDPDVSAVDSFTYVISDSSGAQSQPATVSITISPVNDAPVALDDTITVLRGSAGTTIDLRSNDSDPDGDMLSIISVDDGSNGTVVDNGDGTVTYTHDGTGGGSDSFSYVVSDAGGLSASANVVVIVSPLTDFDGVAAAVDNCPGTFNPTQHDTDGDGIGDRCDATATSPSNGLFIPVQFFIDNHETKDVQAGDLDGDGDLDLIHANYGSGNRVFLNSNGILVRTNQLLGSADSQGLAIGDIDGDGDLDVVFANDGPNYAYLNDGAGRFTGTGQWIGGADSHHVELVDIDNDGDLDLLEVNDGSAHHLWANNGSGNFSLAGSPTSVPGARRADVGDVDGDGDADLVFAHRNGDDALWINDGFGSYTYKPQIFGTGRSEDVALRDLDGDGDIDMVIAGDADGDQVWFNDGAGNFTDSGVVIGFDHSVGVAVGDIDGDGDLDLVFGRHNGPNTFWLNDGTGTFTDAGQRLGNSETESLILADFNGDGSYSIVTANGEDLSMIWDR